MRREAEPTLKGEVASEKPSPGTLKGEVPSERSGRFVVREASEKPIPGTLKGPVRCKER
jgi:hypothetical protein